LLGHIRGELAPVAGEAGMGQLDGLQGTASQPCPLGRQHVGQHGLAGQGVAEPEAAAARFAVLVACEQLRLASPGQPGQDGLLDQLTGIGKQAPLEAAPKHGRHAEDRARLRGRLP
jgi:hypothetical protein